ncbi:hypothetical protein [Acinetobacter shaoyimingii]|uniref:hypothetical protein n=1 Tax=Acinetobacter shaoyimingii TaxID=2715164 RepID=UPI001D0E38DA|nr:hypothetical protein [Acinetobacter shaoyimingii]
MRPTIFSCGGHNVYAYAQNLGGRLDPRGLNKLQGKLSSKNTGGDKKKQPCVNSLAVQEARLYQTPK